MGSPENACMQFQPLQQRSNKHEPHGNFRASPAMEDWQEGSGRQSQSDELKGDKKDMLEM